MATCCGAGHEVSLTLTRMLPVWTISAAPLMAPMSVLHVERAFPACYCWVIGMALTLPLIQPCWQWQSFAWLATVM